jgi:hypothetical protein
MEIMRRNLLLRLCWYLLLSVAAVATYHVALSFVMLDKASLQAVQGLYPNKKTVDVDDGRQSLMVYGNEE